MWEYVHSDELYHHGIKGMKWGVRRYQKKDGSLTAAGKKRYSDKTNAANATANRKTISTAEHEFTGDKLKKSAENYRNEMLKRYTGKDASKTAYYTNASDEVIQQEFIRRENVKKAVIVGATIVGVGAACAIAYRMSATKQVQGLGKNLDTDTVKNALKTANDDLSYILSKDPNAYVLPKGHEIHRMTGFAGFDVSKTAGKRTYVTVNDSDRAAYALFLKDWSGTDERYDVSLKATKNIIAPSDEMAKTIFEKVYKSNPEYKDELRKTITQAYATLYKVNPNNPSLKPLVESMLADPFGAGMYAFVKQGKDADILTKAYTDAGYSAIVDYFDKGSLGKQPMILFNASGDVTKTGERLIKKGQQFVNDVIKDEYVQYLSADRKHPMYKYRSLRI